MQYVKLDILKAFTESDNGYTVNELMPILRMSYTAIGKRLIAYWKQYLLTRTKECKAYRYTLTEIGKSRLKYLQENDKNIS